MFFSKRKLPKEALDSLYRIKIDIIKPFALMIAPVYVLLKVNAKFVSVKAPLDFFTENELKQLASYEDFYFPEFIRLAIPFRNAGCRVREILSIKPRIHESSAKQQYPEVILPLAPFEISNSILRIIGPLWWDYPGQGFGVEPFLVTIFANEVCDPIAPEKLLRAREQNVEALDRAVFRASWVVFLSLHLGYYDLNYINELRNRVFDENMAGNSSSLIRNEIDELIEVAHTSLLDVETRLLKCDFFFGRSERVSQMLRFRMSRIKKELMNHGKEPPSILGERGFIDV